MGGVFGFFGGRGREEFEPLLRCDFGLDEVVGEVPVLRDRDLAVLDDQKVPRGPLVQALKRAQGRRKVVVGQITPKRHRIERLGDPRVDEKGAEGSPRTSTHNICPATKAGAPYPSALLFARAFSTPSGVIGGSVMRTPIARSLHHRDHPWTQGGDQTAFEVRRALSKRPYASQDRAVHLGRAHPGEVLLQPVIIDGVWAEQFVGEGVLRQAIAALRGPLGDDAKHPEYIDPPCFADPAAYHDLVSFRTSAPP